MKQLDCIGKACPIPVIETKKMMNENPDEMDYEIIVDNEVATQNISKMADELKINSNVEKIGDRKYKITLNKTPDSLKVVEEDIDYGKMSPNNGYVVAISDNRMGGGDEEFSMSLLEGFIYALTEQDMLPHTILFYNQGVFLTTKNEKTIEDLRDLEKRGVNVLSCGLCLGHYELKEELHVGEITNMYKIAEIMRSNHVVSPC